jgi:predicted AAA+ superfamily ATPase
MRYLRRSLEPHLRRAIREFPVVVLTGPRQAGKTTILRRTFGRTHGYVSMDLPDVRAAAASDPRGFLDLQPPPVIFDEVQHVPGLLPYVRERVDARRSRAGQYILTGSQNLLLLQGVTETLAGRAAVLRLLPLSFREMAGDPSRPLPWERRGRVKAAPVEPAALWRTFLRGCYPEVASHLRRDAAAWHAAYVQTYLERDVRAVRQVGDLAQFQSFLRALAARSAQLLDLSDLARDLGVAVNTVRAWISVLEATHQIVVVRPYFVNIGKRLVKSPKVYFTDVGTLCYLVGLRDPDHARTGPMAGAILETAVVGEILRALWHRGREPAVYFFRTSTGVEVDLVVDLGRSLVPVEVRSGATPHPGMARSIEIFRKGHGARAARGYLVHPGPARLPLGPNAVALPFAEL